MNDVTVRRVHWVHLVPVSLLCSIGTSNIHFKFFSSCSERCHRCLGQKLWKAPVFFPGNHVVMEGLCLQEMVDWFNAIRAARFHYLQVAFPGASDEEVRETRRLELKLWWPFATPQALYRESLITLWASTHFWQLFIFSCSWCLNWLETLWRKALWRKQVQRLAPWFCFEEHPQN